MFSQFNLTAEDVYGQYYAESYLDFQKEEEKLRMAMRVQSKSKKSTTSSRGAGRSVGGYGADTYHDDGSDDEGAISLAAIKNKYKKGLNTPVKGKFYIIGTDTTKQDVLFEYLETIKCFYTFSVQHIFVG